MAQAEEPAAQAEEPAATGGRAGALDQGRRVRALRQRGGDFVPPCGQRPHRLPEGAGLDESQERAQLVLCAPLGGSAAAASRR